MNKKTIENLSDALALIVEAQRDALRGDDGAALRQALAASEVLKMLPTRM